MAAVPVGVYIAAAAVVGTETYSSVDNAKHAETNASNASNVATDQSNTEIAQANQAQVAKQNQQADATQVAQSRVRAISNPDGDSIMTSPLGQMGSAGKGSGTQGPTPGQTNTSQPTASPGTVMTPGKTTIGG